MNDEEFVQEAANIFLESILQYEDTNDTELDINVQAVLDDGRTVTITINDGEVFDE